MKARTPSGPSAASAIRSAPGECRVARARGEERVDRVAGVLRVEQPDGVLAAGARRPPRLRPRCRRQPALDGGEGSAPGPLPGAGRTSRPAAGARAAGSTRSTTPQASNCSAGKRLPLSVIARARPTPARAATVRFRRQGARSRAGSRAARGWCPRRPRSGRGRGRVPGRRPRTCREPLRCVGNGSASTRRPRSRNRSISGRISSAPSAGEQAGRRHRR